ncbi:hypothetical protein THAOC_37560 [Thalassiosira oceanica]|uniref:Uncharacterized protein n=1 Tax=Thalassiosira oceanica TaxID=159749 RepID=K0QYA3_THAOC|nr:hypothetical protein THAOC_37560 [Thalassiosira oceanica]|eukprot:EJK43948.1 hypothetical protein THAOC_37560 [Thalassiosira oceanica]
MGQALLHVVGETVRETWTLPLLGPRSSQLATLTRNRTSMLRCKQLRVRNDPTLGGGQTSVVNGGRHPDWKLCAVWSVCSVCDSMTPVTLRETVIFFAGKLSARGGILLQVDLPAGGAGAGHVRPSQLLASNPAPDGRKRTYRLDILSSPRAGENPPSLAAAASPRGDDGTGKRGPKPDAPSNNAKNTLAPIARPELPLNSSQGRKGYEDAAAPRDDGPPAKDGLPPGGRFESPSQPRAYEPDLRNRH